MAGSVGTLVDLLLFYTLERLLFNRMVQQMGKNPTLVKLAIALWLMLEEIGYYDLIRKINAFDDWTIEEIFNEALQCVTCIQPNSIEPSGLDDTLVFVGLFDEPMNLRFFYYNKAFMYKRLTHIMESVCGKIFGESGAIEVDETSMRPMVVRPFGEGTSAQGDGTSTSTRSVEGTSAHGDGTSNSTRPVVVRSSSEGTSAQGDGTASMRPVVVRPSGEGTSTQGELHRHFSSCLNPNASEFVPEQACDDTRTMFLTFSKGFPLSREEIFNFFTSKWGDIVEDVVVEQAAGGQAVAPLYGRIKFTTSSVIPHILNGQSRAKFMVGRKHLWARFYIPRRR